MMFYCDYTRCTLKVVRDCLNSGGGKFIIYPFGDIGRRVKSILNVFMGIQESLIVDNFLSQKYDRIKSLDDLTADDLKDAVVLIASDIENVYDELREALYQKVPREQCVELFPKPVETLDMSEGIPFAEVKNTMAFHLMHLASMQTAEYIVTHLPTTTMYANRYELLEHIFLDGLIQNDGLFLEFGVRAGASVNFIAAYHPTKTIYGFDSFEGLPESWNFYAPAGTFSLNGKMPVVRSNVRLIKGWFDQTLPSFIKDHPEPCAFVHIDSDIYSSAKTVFDSLGDKITHGTVIEFDEYFDRPNWQNGEFRAFHEFLDKWKFEYEYLGYCNHGPQCAVRIK